MFGSDGQAPPESGGHDERIPPPDDNAELELYRMLAPEGARAHSRYNALLRELISFEHALDHRLSRLRSA